MLRSVLLVAMLIALCGCGVNVTKTESTSTKVAETPVTVTPKQTEVYDKVAPMPREVKREPAKR